MENKYYTPTIEEFYSGFEYEHLERNGTWKKVDEFSNEYDCEDNPHYEVIKDIEKNKIRVKFLDREDVESCGWNFLKESFPTLDYEKPYRDNRDLHDKVFLHYNSFSKWALITTGNRSYTVADENSIDKPITRFCGHINNISEFKKLMKQLGI